MLASLLLLAGWLGWAGWAWLDQGCCQRLGCCCGVRLSLGIWGNVLCECLQQGEVVIESAND